MLSLSQEKGYFLFCYSSPVWHIVIGQNLCLDVQRYIESIVIFTTSLQQYMFRLFEKSLAVYPPSINSVYGADLRIVYTSIVKTIEGVHG